MNEPTITIPRALFEDLIEDAYELQGEWHYRKDEPRCGYQASYEQLLARIAQAETIRDAKPS